MKKITEKELRKIIRDSIGPRKTYPSQKSLAQAMGVSEQYVSDILRHLKPISNNVAMFFGYRLVKIYKEMVETEL